MPDKPNEPKKIVVQAPYSLAMVICDSVHRDSSTGKSTILGTCSSITSAAYPAVHPGLSVYMALTDGRGKPPMRLRLVSVDEDVILFEGMFEIDFADPRSVFEIAITIGNLSIPKEGEYRLQLFCDSEPIMERRLVAVLLSAKS